MALFMRNWPFIASIAASDDSKSVYATKPYPFESPVPGSRAICGVIRNSHLFGSFWSHVLLLL